MPTIYDCSVCGGKRNRHRFRSQQVFFRSRRTGRKAAPDGTCPEVVSPLQELTEIPNATFSPLRDQIAVWRISLRHSARGDRVRAIGCLERRRGAIPRRCAERFDRLGSSKIDSRHDVHWKLPTTFLRGSWQPPRHFACQARSRVDNRSTPRRNGRCSRPSAC